MPRTKVFISYSHDDLDWLKRFSQHIAVLERQKLVDIWSDTRIGVGSDWEGEIESALTAARVAVLLVSPAFLASDYIWQYEIDRILAHYRQGMHLLPLIVRPCAWRLERSLFKLQARPSDGRALSQGSDSQIDSDLSAIVYELAARLGRSPAADGVSSADSPRYLGTEEETELIGKWEGRYNQTRKVHLLVRESHGGEFRGQMEYPVEGTVTSVKGFIHERWFAEDPVWAQVGGAVYDDYWTAVSFRETDYEIKGSGSISFEGEYRVFVNGGKMMGGWFLGPRLVGELKLQRAQAEAATGKK
jgi:hypothetical protein